MLVPRDLRKCVAYLTVNVLDEASGLPAKRPIGTVFLVSVPVEDIGFCLYAVTARHVIDASRPYGQLYMRVNLRPGGFTDILAPPQDDWEMHHTTDVAAILVVIENLGALDVKALPVDLVLTDAAIVELGSDHPLAEGDEILFVGLFTSHPGNARSEPVTRFGHIARMPYDPIPIKMDPAPGGAYVPVRAYLAEAAAWGGQSGSPAFVHFSPTRVPGLIQVGGMTGGGFGLLGLVHGHYPFEQRIAIESGDITGQGKIDFNLGISVVIPAEDVLSVLNSDPFVTQRENAADQYRNRKSANPNMPTGDSGVVTNAP